MTLLDTNILLEILERRRQYEEVLEAINRLGASEPLAITTLTLNNVFYIAEKNKLDPGAVERLAGAYRWLEVLAEDGDWALAHYKGKDFEDALQVAVALRSKCQSIATLDVSMAKKYRKFLPIELVGSQ